MRRRILMSCAIGCAAILMFFVQTPQASATGQPECPGTTRICFFDHPYPDGGAFTSDVAGTGCVNIWQLPWRTGYIDNDAKAEFWVYLGKNCTGTKTTVFARSHGAMAGKWYESILSYKGK